MLMPGRHIVLSKHGKTYTEWVKCTLSKFKFDGTYTVMGLQKQLHKLLKTS